MVTTRKKSTTTKPKAGAASSRTAGAGMAVAERSKDARPAFGKASPKKVAAAQEAGRPKSAKTTAANRAAKPGIPKSAAGTPPANAADQGSVVTKVAHAAKTTAAVAVGAVVATVKLASRRNGGGD